MPDSRKPFDTGLRASCRNVSWGKCNSTVLIDGTPATCSGVWDLLWVRSFSTIIAIAQLRTNFSEPR